MVKANLYQRAGAGLCLARKDQTGLDLRRTIFLSFAAQSARARSCQKRILSEADWVFTSAVAVEAFSPYLKADFQIATIGPQTSQALDKLGRDCAFEPAATMVLSFIQSGWLWTSATQRRRSCCPRAACQSVWLRSKKEAGHEVGWPVRNDTQSCWWDQLERPICPKRM